MTKDWYEHRDELQQGQVFIASDGSVVRLDRSVPGDGTKWYVNDWHLHGGWIYDDSTIEPGDLTGQPIEDSPKAIARAQLADKAKVGTR